MVQKHLDAGRTRWVRVAPKLPSYYLVAGRKLGWMRVASVGYESHPSWLENTRLRVALVSASRIRWMRVALGCSVSAWKLFPWEIVGLAAGRTQHRHTSFWTVFSSLFKGINSCFVQTWKTEKNLSPLLLLSCVEIHRSIWVIPLKVERISGSSI